MRLTLFLWLVLCFEMGAATTTVTLATATNPAAGQAGTGYLSVVGTGFPAGTIPPGDVIVALTPAAGGTVATTKAVKVTAKSGTTESVLFQIPSTIAVSAPAVYAVSLTGKTSSGSRFTSGNTAALTIDPAVSLESVAPDAANAALTLMVTLTGIHTSFVQGATTATFGPGITAGPVTVTTPTTATLQISIDPAAAPGAQTVTVTTGTAVESLAGGFTVLSAVAVADVNTESAVPLAAGFSGFNDSYLLNGVEYWDPKYLPLVEAMKPGWIRFPGGTTTMAFDWQAGHENPQWIQQLAPNVGSGATVAMLQADALTQAKGGAYLADFITFCQTVGARAIVDFNAWTDVNANSAALMVQATEAAGLPVNEWELANEPYFYPGVFPTAGAYAGAVSTPYYVPINATDASATVGLFYQGQFSGLSEDYEAWDSGMNAYTPQYWQSVSMHIYPVANSTLTTSEEEQTLNGILAHGTNEYFNSYVIPLTGAHTPLFLTEFNADGFGTLPFENYIYNALFLAEYIARVATVPNVQAVGVNQLYLGNESNFGAIRAANDFQTYLTGQVKANPSYSTNTATDPNTQFQFYNSTNALALQILNIAVNSSNATWTTTLSGGPTVPILGYDGQPVPAVFAQAFQGTDGTHYLILTNKSGTAVPVGVEVNGVLGPTSVQASSISSTSDTVENTATNQTAVQIVNSTFSNPLLLGPYSVTRLQW